MKTASTTWIAVGAALILALVGSAPRADDAEPEPKSKDLPAEVEAPPAIDFKKLADNVNLRAATEKNRATSARSLLQIGIAIHKYASANNDNWPADIVDKNGKALLSWRVAILPSLGEKKLYEKFKLDQPWDSKHNRPLVEQMPKVLDSPRVTLKRKGYTVFQVFSGPGALFEKGKSKYKVSNVPDGTSNTILVVESSKAVPWSKPADIAYDGTKAIPPFGKSYDAKPQAILGDGTVRVLDLNKILTATLKNAICPDDGQVLGNDWTD